MHIQTARPFTGTMLEKLRNFLRLNGLDYDPSIDFSVMLCEDDEIIATASLDGNTVKCAAVSPIHRGEGWMAQLMTTIRQEAFQRGADHLMLYTKPANSMLFREFGFHPIVRTDSVLLMENTRHGLDDFLSALERPASACKTVGCIVANCNPFTLGHRYLIETAARQVDALHVFILSENKGMFSPNVRLSLVKAGCADLKNVFLHFTGSYMVSAATFPIYFIKDKSRAEDIHCEADIRLFGERFVPALNITHRFVGTEPNCSITNAYNARLKSLLPDYGVNVMEIPRRENAGEAISASRVRALLAQGDWKAIEPLVPETTYQYLIRSFAKA